MAQTNSSTRKDVLEEVGVEESSGSKSEEVVEGVVVGGGACDALATSSPTLMMHAFVPVPQSELGKRAGAAAAEVEAVKEEEEEQGAAVAVVDDENDDYVYASHITC